MGKIADAVANVGQYTDPTDGKVKKRRVKVGALFENEYGKSLKLDAIPCSPDWDGYINFYTTDDARKDYAVKGVAQAKAAMAGDSLPSDDIPF